MSTLTFVERNELHSENASSEAWIRSHGYDFTELFRQASGLEMAFNLQSAPCGNTPHEDDLWAVEILRYDEDGITEFVGKTMELRNYLLWTLNERSSKLWSEACSMGINRDTFVAGINAQQDRFDVLRVEQQVKKVEEERVNAEE